MKLLLTVSEVRSALNQDDDYPVEDCQTYAELASSYIKQKTGYDFAEDEVIDPEAKEAAKQFIKQSYYGADGYNREQDYSIGIACMIEDLQDKAHDKAVAAAAEAEA